MTFQSPQIRVLFLKRKVVLSVMFSTPVGRSNSRTAGMYLNTMLMQYLKKMNNNTCASLTLCLHFCVLFIAYLFACHLCKAFFFVLHKLSEIAIDFISLSQLKHCLYTYQSQE